MNNESILEKIISNKKIEEIQGLNSVEIINNLIKQLSDRERDILSRRFGLNRKEKETLEAVGDIYKLTRERIRQIEIAGIRKLQRIGQSKEFTEILKKVIINILEEHGGFVEKEYLFKILTHISVDSDKDQDKKVHENNLDFLISKLLPKEFENYTCKYFKKSYKLRYQCLEYLKEIAQSLIEKIEETKKVLKTEEIIDLIKNSHHYEKNKEKIISTLSNVNVNININVFFGNHFFKENHEIVSNNKILYSFLKSLKQIRQNKFGYWGIHSWREIKPKTINDKTYLVLKNNGSPIHFSQIAQKINEVAFDDKKANVATVHNELILDKRYVLVGRGIYGLKEWGYKKGTVLEVVKEILKTNENPLSRNEIVEKVLEKRKVKKSTIVLALTNKKYFENIGNHKYKLKSEQKNH